MPALALGLLAGSWWQLQQAQLLPPLQQMLLLAVGLLLLGLAQWRLWQRWRCRGWLLLAGAACCAWAVADWRSQTRLEQRLPSSSSGRLQVVEGRIADLPQLGVDSARFVFTPLRPRLAPRLQVSWQSGRGGADPLPELVPGQIWSLPLRLKAVHGNANPYGSDAELWQFERGIAGSASVSHSRKLDPPRLLGYQTGPALLLPQLRQRLRQRMLMALAAAPQAGTVVALALGDQSAIPASTWALYRSTGIAHLVSVSGLHITLLAGLCGGLAAALWRRLIWREHAAPLLLATPELALLVRVGAATSYAALAGFGVPAQRALLMLVVASLTRISGAAPDWWQAMAWSAAAVLAWDPWAVLAPGFWLSFGAVAMLFMADAARATARQPPAPWWRRAAQRLGGATRAQLAVSLGLAPLTLLLFQQLAWAGPLANAVAIPLVTLWVVPLALAGLLLPAPLDAWSWRLAELSQRGLNALLQPLADWQLPWGMAAPDPLALLLAVLGSLVLAVDWGWRLRLPGLLLLLPALANPGRTPAAGHVQAWLADVGQGSAVLVRTAHHALLFDAGPSLGPDNDAGSRLLVPLLHGLGLRRIDLLVLSHADSDHIGGAAAVVRAFGRPPALASVPQSRLRQIGLERFQLCRAGQAWNWDGVDFTLLHPPQPASVAGAYSNAASCVLRVASRHGSLLLTGDIERAQERALVRSGAALHSDLLLVPHHGSSTSSSAELLWAVMPAALAIQVGYASAYGHPHPLVLQRLAGSGAAIWRSDRDGALWWDDRRPDWLCSWRGSHRRYWQQQWPGGPAAGCRPDLK